MTDRRAKLNKLARLIYDLTRREIATRYSGTALGVLWAFVNPLILLAVYSVIFGSIFQSRWGASGSTIDFALVLFIGLIVFNFFSECVNRASGLIVANPNYVKKIVFPLHIFPVVVIGTAWFHALISLVAWVVMYAFFHGSLHWTTVFVLLLYIPVSLLTLGLSFFLCSLGVYFRDIGQFTSLVTQSMLFLSPVFYSLEQAPPVLRGILTWNPLTFVIEESRSVMLDGNLPDWIGLLTSTGYSVVVLMLGFWWFQRTRDGFADVI